MKNIKLYDSFSIHCYKHDGTIYTTYDKSILLDVKKDYLVLANNKAKVTEIDGRIWYTKEPAITFYFKDNWYNVIAQFKKDGIYYYCNIASPTVVEGHVIKYIDYDLDLRCFPDGTYKVLDEAEYEYHKLKMNYPEEINTIVNQELKNLIELYKKKIGPFDTNLVEKYYKKYLSINKNIL